MQRGVSATSVARRIERTTRLNLATVNRYKSNFRQPTNLFPGTYKRGISPAFSLVLVVSPHYHFEVVELKQSNRDIANNAVPLSPLRTAMVLSGFVAVPPHDFAFM